ncbi:helix-turn-helix protein [Actinoplanes lutulentus]|uniref:Helix-turn-helix protein n=2 Tax=Actinoplanes lutulentus TaxID=1287878 RepID=A0A327ZPU3_9ACTN|nr:helix-turn-helix transcriptional regulator [Actinoplanes lutulentus]RAK42738.1 helix-turn-helix protein [Actinoplanes lutulentus]
MGVTQGEPPAVARRRVRFALRRFRAATGLNQSQVAKRLSWSLSKIQRIEGGEVAVSVTDLRALFDLYGIEDGPETDRLVEDAQIARRQRWHEAAEYRRHLSKGVRQLLQFEAEARVIKVYQPALVPGVLQTSAYANSVLNWWDKSLSADDRRVRYDVRMLRKRQILDRRAGPEYHLILDQSALLREVGGARVMAEQLESLEEVSRLANVHVRCVPFDKGPHAAVLGPFQIIDLGEGDDDDAVLYREFYNRDNVTHDPDEIEFYRVVFEKLWSNCRDEDSTRRAILLESLRLRQSLEG